MISIQQEDDPTVFSVWHHNSFEEFNNGICLSSHTFKLHALEAAKLKLQENIRLIDKLIQNIHDNTTTKKLERNT